MKLFEVPSKRKFQAGYKVDSVMFTIKYVLFLIIGIILLIGAIGSMVMGFIPLALVLFVISVILLILSWLSKKSSEYNKRMIR